jgi:hypothetical protein
VLEEEMKTMSRADALKRLQDERMKPGF